MSPSRYDEVKSSALYVKPATRRRKLPSPAELRQAPGMRPTAALLPFSLMVMAIMTVPTLVLDEQGLPRYRHLRGEVEELRDANEVLAREIAGLKSDIEALRADPSYIERIARDELGMVRQEELVFQFPPK
jgi:cell division protein FtsB